jgi:hypothetical protein
MPKSIVYLECDCGGILAEICKTLPHTGMQFGDSTEQSVIHHCPVCDKILISGLGEFVPYTGPLTLVEMATWAPEVNGYWCDWTETNVLAKARPRAWKDVKTVRSARNAYQGIVTVPKELVGMKLFVRLATEEEIKSKGYLPG